jgi:metal-responsive CopG/Arc/MetJ family transcriptional regulator
MRYTVEEKREHSITVNVTRQEMDDFLLAVGSNKRSSILRKMVLDYIQNDKKTKYLNYCEKNN